VCGGRLCEQQLEEVEWQKEELQRRLEEVQEEKEQLHKQQQAEQEAKSKLRQEASRLNGENMVCGGGGVCISVCVCMYVCGCVCVCVLFLWFFQVLYFDPLFFFLSFFVCPSACLFHSLLT